MLKKKSCVYVSSGKLRVGMPRHQFIRLQPRDDQHYSFMCRWCSLYCTIKKTEFWGKRREPLLQRIFNRLANPGMWF
jgi:hypothetical protein